MVDGVVKKVKTDDTHEDSIEHPQIRACARGRSQQHQCFGADRLKYPMKRKNWEPGGGKKELRGRDEWERISWDEALDLIATELKRLYDTYGPESILECGNTLSSVFTMMGGCVTGGNTSWGRGTTPAIRSAWATVCRTPPQRPHRTDEVGPDRDLGRQRGLELAGQHDEVLPDAKRAGAKFIFIDPFYNDTAMILADEWFPVRPATDHALALGMAYTLITEDDPETNPLLDWDFIDRCTVGFDADRMPEGADPKDNFKDYVLGTYDGVPKTPSGRRKSAG